MKKVATLIFVFGLFIAGYPYHTWPSPFFGPQPETKAVKCWSVATSDYLLDLMFCVTLPERFRGGEK